VIRRGVTLIELLVVLAILGLTVLVAVPLAGSRAGSRVVSPSIVLRTAAIRDGRVRSAVDSSMQRGRLAAYPDGLVITDSTLRLDPFSGHSQPESVRATR